ncbi:uncharacterized protein LOC110994284 [Pieris rapae]|uniref:uncharacterized protein LOC110994284 n=1 Tax=Pieris rapae TaxID=64459 RepID=UPI001E27A5AE|nr:uncharacterized protein LOC110994284 [Pieris rapae]
MSEMEGGLFFIMEGLLNKDYRGVNIAVYSLATAGLALAIHKVRPVSKFSKASKIPEHFIKQHEPLRGVYVGVKHSPVRVLVNHKAPIYIPLWHSSKPPLPVKLWGVDIVSPNAVNWLDCVAKGQKVTLKPMTCDKDELVSTVLLHLPQPKTKSEETLDIGQKLIELGFAKALLPQGIKKNSMESKLAPVLLNAENKAKSLRNGIWSDKLPPIPSYVAYWRKGSTLSKELMVMSSRKIMEILIFILKGTFVGVKKISLRPFKSNTKPVQAT